jgi:hypothetical protein
MDSGSTILIVLVLFLASLIWAIVQDKQQRVREMDAAQKKYFDALAALKAHPINADLRERALALGRAYSAITRQQKGAGKAITIYDEVAINNDIGAACAAAVKLSAPAAPRPAKHRAEPHVDRRTPRKTGEA